MTYYELLGGTPQATAEEIRSAAVTAAYNMQYFHVYKINLFFARRKNYYNNECHPERRRAAPRGPRKPISFLGNG